MNKDVLNTSDTGKVRTGSYQRSDDVIRRSARLAEQNRQQSEPKAAQASSKGLMTKSGEYSTSSHRERKPEGDWPKKKIPRLVGGTREEARRYIDDLKESDPTSYREYRNYENLRKKLTSQGVDDSVSRAAENHPIGYEISNQYQSKYYRKEESSSSHRHTTGQLRLTQSDEIRRQRIKEEDEKSLRDRGLEPDSW